MVTGTSTVHCGAHPHAQRNRAGVAELPPRQQHGSAMGAPRSVTAAPCPTKDYGQCGGLNFPNATCCPDDQVCVRHDKFYSGCQDPSPSPPSSPPAPASLTSWEFAFVGVSGLVLLMGITWLSGWASGRCRRWRAIARFEQAQRALLLANATDEDSSCYENAEFVRPLGRGSSGDVSLMRVRVVRDAGEGDTGGLALVVLKRLTFDDDGGGDAAAGGESAEIPTLERLWNEVRILASLTHPHIVRYLHASQHFTQPGCHAGELKIFMEYADGGTLAAAVRRQRKQRTPFTSVQVQRWAGQLAGALQYVHSREVLHRDVKSANVFLSGAGDVKLGDFGVARPLSTFTHFASTIVGTPYSLAPEVCSGSQYAFPADVWAVGVVLYELLTLERPFESEHLSTLVVKIGNGAYDATQLANCPHSPRLCRLASSECLLHTDQVERMRLDELLAALQPTDDPGHPTTGTRDAPATPA